MEIAQIEKNLARTVNKKLYLKEQLEKADPSIKPKIQELLVKTIKESGIVKLKNLEKVEYHLTYDSFGEGLEPIYFWILDFMRDSYPSGLGLEVEKAEEAFEATASSSYFGELGTRASIMEDRAMKMMQTVNAVIRSIINLLYDLKEFKIRLDTYEDLKNPDPEKKKAAELALRALWMDVVDIKRGRGSINALAQDLQFVTLRDAFMYAKELKEVETMDLNARVKGILKRKLEEYLLWKDNSEKELRKRHNIEKQYLKSQVASLKLYTKWAKPYFKAAQQLKMKDFKSPDLVAVFNNMVMELRLIGKKEIKPESVFPEYKKIPFKNKVYSVIEVSFRFRSVPQSLRSQAGQQFVHGGLSEITFTPYVFSDDELKALEQEEFYEDLKLVEELTNQSLGELQKDLEELFKEEEKKEPEKKKKELIIKSPFGNLGKGFKEALSPVKHMLKFGEHSYEVKKVKEKAQETAINSCFVLYDVYKKAHGMLSWE